MSSRIIFLIAIGFFSSLVACCEVRLPNLISDGMVLQRNSKVNIWGWAAAGEKIKLQFRNKIYATVTNSAGNWKIVLTPMLQGGPYSMIIDGNNHVVVNNILIGDVWICSGQSNMVLPMERVKEKYPEEITASENNLIRHYFLPTRYNFNYREEDTPPGKWESANPVNVLQFTAAGYFFAKELFAR